MNTFSECVIVDGITYNIGQCFFDKTGDDCWKIPFKAIGNNPTFLAVCSEIAPTIGDVRKAVISQVKHLKKIGTINDN